MKIKEVNSKKFDALHEKRIDLKRCPACSNYDAEIVIPMPAYGKYQNTVYVRCKQCGHQTHHHKAWGAFADTENKRYGSWMSDKSLLHAIRSAIEEWNGKRDKSCDNCAFYNEDSDNQPCCYCAENSCWVKGEEDGE